MSEQVHVFKASVGGWTGYDYWLTGSYDTENLVFVPTFNKEVRGERERVGEREGKYT